ncbi:hypothetical protein RHSIM_Rhsim05G0233800 [Rhododendron simsii]|uniref:Uncharacterized protein n=1 Tax=Rhododendron simsii TaxID=118357 RepID=A0A834LMX4_RHOSS|nr:hypothetical protein RHSIM_Rhsim05G0233800 [Rhododendron simsii]
MAYRRRQGITRASTFKEEIHHQPDHDNNNNDSSSNPSSSSSLAAQAIRASAAHRDSSSLSSAYAHSSFHSSFHHRSKDVSTNEYTSMQSLHETKGFWGVLAQKAKAILEEDNISQQFEEPIGVRTQMPDAAGGQFYEPYQSLESSRKVDNPRLRKGLDALTSSLNHIGDTIGNALEEGRSIVEHKTADIIQETRKLQIRRKGSSSDEQNQIHGAYNPWNQPSVQSSKPQMQTNQETQLKASRDVAMATAAKAKLLLRELKTVKADLAFAKERCSQLEEENRILREARDKGDYPADDDMIRLQLETLLAEKARLAHENSVYARENRFLREIVEYHQLTMQDVVYLDEGIEEVTEVYPIPAVSRMLSVSPTSPVSPRSPAEIPQIITPSLKKQTSAEIPRSITPPLKKQTSSAPNQPHATADVHQIEAPPCPDSLMDGPRTEALPISSSIISTAHDSTRHADASA